MKMWTNPYDQTDTQTVYCMTEADQDTPNTYSFIQPWANDFDLLPRRDSHNKNARADMFYFPKRVNNFGD